jgi:hypothetical protein
MDDKLTPGRERPLIPMPPEAALPETRNEPLLSILWTRLTRLFRRRS